MWKKNTIRKVRKSIFCRGFGKLIPLKSYSSNFMTKNLLISLESLSITIFLLFCLGSHDIFMISWKLRQKSKNKKYGPMSNDSVGIIRFSVMKLIIQV